MSVVVVGVGSNLGAREALIRGAGALLSARGGIEVRGVSEIYETEPLGPPQPRYLNAAFRMEPTLAPAELLHVLLRTERRLGRRRVPDERWGQTVNAVLSLEPGAGVTDDELVAHARTQIAAYKTPKRIFRVDSILRGPNGKPDYQWARKTAEESVGS